MILFQYPSRTLRHGAPAAAQAHAAAHASTAAGTAAAWSPRVDIREDASQFLIVADVPGVDLDAIEIEADGNVLTLRGQRAEDLGEASFARRERATGEFSRRFELPEHVDASAITATGANGVLRISLPKKAQPQPRRIPVAVNAHPVTVTVADDAAGTPTSVQ